MSAKSDLEVVSNAAELARTAAHLFLDQSVAAVGKKGVFSVALSGGSTPKRLYELLANQDEPFRGQLPWDKTHFFWTDERHVPPDNPESNYRMANEALLARAPVPRKQVHRMRGELANAEEAAAEYEVDLKEFFAHEPLPRFDLVLLGLGTEGHTASIFPGSPVLEEEQRLVAAPWVEKLDSYRITLTPPVLNNAALVLFLVSGQEKAEILRDVLQREVDQERLPAQAIKPANGRLLWLVDQAAASNLSESGVLAGGALPLR
jgi:6-phosphogluconolactonase